MSGYLALRGWSDQFLPALEGVGRLILPKITDLRFVPGGDLDDRYRMIDYVLVADTGPIAARVRNVAKTRRWRDLTIRARVPSGGPTEIHKIRDGFGRWYIYGWAADGVYHQFVDWMVVSLDQVRDTGLLEDDWRLWDNRDGTFFIAIPFRTLVLTGSIVAASPGLWAW